MLAVAIRPNSLSVIYRIFKSLISPDSPVVQQEVLGVFNDHIRLFMDPDFLTGEECYESSDTSFLNETFVEEMLVELFDEIVNQLAKIDLIAVGRELIVSKITVINDTTALVEYYFKEISNDRNTVASTNRLDSFLRNVRPSDHRSRNIGRRGVVTFGRRKRKNARWGSVQQTRPDLSATPEWYGRRR